MPPITYKMNIKINFLLSNIHESSPMTIWWRATVTIFNESNKIVDEIEVGLLPDGRVENGTGIASILDFRSKKFYIVLNTDLKARVECIADNGVGTGRTRIQPDIFYIYDYVLCLKNDA